MIRSNLTHLSEPELTFGFDQSLPDPRDGLSLFGPLDQAKPFGIRMAVVGTDSGVALFRRWLKAVSHFIARPDETVHRPDFPGFEEIFQTRLSAEPVLVRTIPQSVLLKRLYEADGHKRVYNTVDLFSEAILSGISEEENAADIWFVVIPDVVHKYCRPQSRVESSLRTSSPRDMSPRLARTLQVKKSLFEEDHQRAEPYLYEINFHNQLKARLLRHRAVTQIAKESTLATIVGDEELGNDALKTMRPQMAWNLCTTSFYKAGGRPWKLTDIRDGVCYIGLVFKKDETHTDPRWACCAAQMFLDSGDGIVFRGALGPWYNQDLKSFHIGRNEAADLVRVAISTYASLRGRAPSELFIHGKANFSRAEWEGFTEGGGANTKVTGVRIRKTAPLRIYSKHALPALRGLMLRDSDLSAYLWTRGFIPRLQTYPGLEVPAPISIDICGGHEDINVVASDVLALTKLNYNACIYGDGVPVTLRFADAIGEILTAGPQTDVPPLPFKHYI